MSNIHPILRETLFKSLIKHRELIWALVKRDFIGRYKGSFFGVLWSLFNPILMLIIYTLVFAVVFKARWGIGNEDESKVAFGIVLFSGLIVHGLLAECLNGAPTLIISHVNFVKKVVFPLHVLPWVSLISASLQFLIGLGILIIFCIISGVTIHIGTLLIPIVLLPLMLFILGTTWFLASLGVYLRDLAQGMGIITTALLFISPVFYRTDTLPAAFQTLLAFNPLTLPITQLRDVMLWGTGINWEAWTLNMAISIAVGYAGFWWFQKSRHGFADVL